MRVHGFCLAWSVTCLLCVLAPEYAPIPRPRPKDRPPLVGEWRLTWGPGGGRCLFRRDGSYRYTWASSDYSGTWSLQGDTLTLDDRPHEADPETPATRYRVELLPGQWMGRSTWGDHVWRLTTPGATPGVAP